MGDWVIVVRLHATERHAAEVAAQLRQEFGCSTTTVQAWLFDDTIRPPQPGLPRGRNGAYYGNTARMLTRPSRNPR